MTAKFCPECGTPTQGAKFCPECGTPTTVGGGAETSAPASPAPATPEPERDVWTGSPDPVLSPVGAKSTKYRITTERVCVESGLLGKKVDSLDLYRVRDLRVHKSMTQRARGRGDLTITSIDASTPELRLESIEKPDDVAETLRGVVRTARQAHGVTAREML